MKKVLAFLLAAVMLLSIVPMSVSAKVADDDKLVTELLSDDFYHLNYVKENDYFKSKLVLYTALSLYDDAWDNYFSGSVDTDYAKTILLALIDRVEEEYKNETYEKIISVLSGAKTVAELIEKVDKYTKILDLANNSSWATSLGVIGTAIKAMKMTNELYEQYVQGYAVILSCQAANNYYNELLGYIKDTCDDKNVKSAATDLKDNITSSLEDARDKLIAQIAVDAAKGSAEIGIELAMDSYSVTSVIKTVYKTIGNLGDKLFNTKDKYQYMSSLAMLARIENVMPAYVNDVLAGDDELADTFALSSLATIRETGETMLANLGKVTEDAVSEKLVDTADLTEMITTASVEAAKLSLYRDIIESEGQYKTFDVFTSTDSSKRAVVYDKDGLIVMTLPATGEKKVIEETGACASTYCEATGDYIKVMVAFAEDYEVVYKTPSKPSTGSGSSSGGFASIFQSLFKALADLFKNLFKFGK